MTTAAVPADGFHRLASAHSGDLLEHLLRLDKPDRRLRFMGVVKDAHLRRFVAGLDWTRSVHFGWYANGALRGVAHAAWPPLPGLEGAEIGVSVEIGWRRRGIARQLIALAVAACRDAGQTKAHLFTLRDNAAAMALAARYRVSWTLLADGLEGVANIATDGKRSSNVLS